LLDNGVALGTNLLVGSVLNRMRDKDPRRFGKTQRGRLSLGGIDKHVGRDDNRRLAVILEPYCVVQTARYAGPSIGEAFDNEVALLQHLLTQVIGGRTGRRQFPIMFDFDVGH
jgi:hypothetical protein